MEGRQPFTCGRNDEDQAATQEGQTAAQEGKTATQEDQAATQDIQEVCYCIICTTVIRATVIRATVIFKLKYNIKQTINCFLFNFFTPLNI